MKYKTLNILGYDVFKGDLKEVDWTTNKIVVNTINQYSYCVAREDQGFEKALKEGDILLPDGVGVVWAAKWLKGQRIQKIAGADIHRFLLEQLQSSGGRCFYMGSSEKVLDKIEKRIAFEYPNVVVSSYSPPYKKKFSVEDNEKMINAINSFLPDVVFIGMTAPKQEKWVLENHSLIQQGVVCSIGAVFDFYAGTIERPGRLWQKLGLEWLGRLIKEPKRMWKRYLYYGCVFGYHLMIRRVNGIKPQGKPWTRKKESTQGSRY